MSYGARHCDPFEIRRYYPFSFQCGHTLQFALQGREGIFGSPLRQGDQQMDQWKERLVM